ncbi:hypothetical protein JLK41_09165 [Ectopseudomonas khazarica]|uniref:hypothetical protein n=1 Tax=Ectopseudomonas khazarica TaxID=2502979 RepID=UPI001AEF661A|nr:hypothetical protein [Pseudomonas khazarica]QTS88310.1 hypothetical protein JLK41_09165 [Pseudomonas khazarica]
MQPACLDLPVIPGATNRKPLYLLQPRFERKAISEILKTPSLQLTVPAHGLPAEWPCWVEGVSGWSALNRQPPQQAPWMVGVIDAATVEINALNGAEQNARGGWLVYQPGVDLTDATAKLTLTGPGYSLELTTANDGLQVLGVGRLNIVLTPTQSAAIPLEGVTYALDITWSNGDVDRWLDGPVTVRRGGGHGCCT